MELLKVGYAMKYSLMTSGPCPFLLLLLLLDAAASQASAGPSGLNYV